MNSILLTFFLFCFPQLLKGSSYCLDAQHLSTAPLTHVQIFGERCSGTKYLKELLSLHFPSLIYNQPYGWEHGPAWFSAPREVFPGPTSHYTLENNASCLFFILVRHPYDWLRSFHKTPYHGKAGLPYLSLQQFVRTPWEIGKNEPEFIKKIDRDPFTGKLFKNVLKLRSARLLNMLLIKEKVLNYYYIQYEQLRDHPQEVIEEIARSFALTPLPFTPIQHDCQRDPNKRGTFHAPPPFIPSRKLLKQILSELDLTIEQTFGYELIP